MATNVERLVNINHRINWVYEKMTGHIRDAILTYRGMEGKEAKDLYGKITDAPKDTVSALLSRKIKSMFDSKDYPVQDYLLVNNHRLNEADFKLNGLIEAMDAHVRGNKEAALAALAAIPTNIAIARGKVDPAPVSPTK